LAIKDIYLLLSQLSIPSQASIKPTAMNKIMIVFIFTFQLNICFSQSVSVNTDGTSADLSAILDVKSISKGMLIPRVTNAQKNAISSPATGLLVYQTDGSPGFWFYNGATWKNLANSSASSPGLATFSSLDNGTMVVVYTDQNAYGFCTTAAGTPTWFVQALSGSVTAAIATDSAIVICSSNTAYGFTRTSAGTPTWYSQSLASAPVGITGSGNKIVVSTSSDLYGFAKTVSGTPTWYSQSASGTPIGAVSNNKDCIIIYTSSFAYGFHTSSGGTPNWYPQSLSGTPIAGSASGKFLVVYTSDTAYGFTKSAGGTPNWYLQSLTGTPTGIVPD
jgi:hypothetical protein